MGGAEARPQAQTFRDGGRQDGQGRFRPRPLKGLQYVHNPQSEGISICHWIQVHQGMAAAAPRVVVS